MNFSMTRKMACTVMVVALSSLVLFAASSMAQMLVDKPTLADLHAILKHSKTPTLVYRSPVDCPLQVEAARVKKRKATFQVFGSGMELAVFDVDGVEHDVIPLNHRDMLRLKVTSDTLSVKLSDDDDIKPQKRRRRQRRRRGYHYDIKAAASSFSLRCTPAEEEEPPPPTEILF